MTRTLAPIAFIFLSASLGGTEANVPGFGKHGVGFEIIKTVDPARTFPAAGKASSAPAVPRPVTIYIWYPAEAGSPSGRLFVRDYFEYMAADWGFVTDEKCSRVESLLKNYHLFKGTPAEVKQGILKMEARASLQARPSKGRFPLIVFGQGWGYESPAVNYALCEYLASHGYVVASATFVGSKSVETQVNLDDLEAETADMDFVIRTMKQEASVDPGKIGVAGFDLGGMAAMLLQIRNTEVKALVSLHSGIMFVHNIKLLKESPDYDPSRLRVPLLHFTNTREEIVGRPEHLDTPSGLLEDSTMIRMSSKVDRYIIRLRNMHHQDFTSLSRLGIYDESKMTDEIQGGHEAHYRILCRATLSFLNSYLMDDHPGRRKLDVRSFLDGPLSEDCQFEQYRRLGSGLEY